MTKSQKQTVLNTWKKNKVEFLNIVSLLCSFFFKHVLQDNTFLQLPDVDTILELDKIE